MFLLFAGCDGGMGGFGGDEAQKPAAALSGYEHLRDRPFSTGSALFQQRASLHPAPEISPGAARPLSAQAGHQLCDRRQ